MSASICAAAWPTAPKSLTNEKRLSFRFLAISTGTKVGLNSKLHAVCEGIGWSLALCLSEGQRSDHIDAKLTYPALLNHATRIIGDKGHDSDEYRACLQAKGIPP